MSKQLIFLAICIFFSTMVMAACDPNIEGDCESYIQQRLQENNGVFDLSPNEIKNMPNDNSIFNTPKELIETIEESGMDMSKVSVSISSPKTGSTYEGPLKFRLYPSDISFGEETSAQKNSDGSITIGSGQDQSTSQIEVPGFDGSIIDEVQAKFNADGSYEINKLVKKQGQDFSDSEVQVEKGDLKVEISSGKKIEVHNLKFDAQGNQISDTQVKLEAGWIKINGKTYKDIRDASFILGKDGEIKKAEFTAAKTTLHEFSIKDNQYGFFLEEGGKVALNLEEGNLKIDKAKSINAQDFSLYARVDPTRSVAESQFSVEDVQINFDSDGNPIDTTFTGGTLDFHNGMDVYSAHGPVTHVHDGNKELFEELAQTKGTNVVYGGKDEVLLKGRVGANSLGKGEVSYIGKDSNSLTSFDQNARSFDVVEGDAILKNAGYEVDIAKGEARVKKIGDVSGSDFSFTHKTGGDAVVSGAIRSGSYEVSYFGLNGEQINPDVYSFDLEKLDQGQGITSRNLVANDVVRKSLEAKKKVFDYNLQQMDKNTPEFFGVKLDKIKNDLQLQSFKEEEINFDKSLTAIKNDINSIERLAQTSSGSQLETLQKLKGKYYTHAGDILSQKIATGKDYSSQDQFEARNYYSAAKESGSLSLTDYAIKDIGLHLAENNRPNAEEARRKATELLGYAYTDKTKSEAQRLIGLSLIQEASTYANDKDVLGIKMTQAYDALREATIIDPDNVNAQQTFDRFKSSQFSSIESLAQDEFKKISIDLATFSNDLQGSRWQGFMDVFSTIGEPWTILHKWTYQDQYFGSVETSILEAQRIGEGARQLNNLLVSGVDPISYQSKDFWGKFTDLYLANGFDDLVSGDALKQYINDPGFRNAGQDRDKLNFLMNTLAENEGINLNSYEFQSRFLSTVKAMGDIEYGIQQSETLKSLVTEGADFASLPDRLSDGIKIDGPTSAALFTADVVANPLNLVGAGFAARGAGYTAKTGSKLLVTGGLKESLEAWGTITTRRFAAGLATESAIGLGVSTSLVGINDIDPTLGKALGVSLGIFGLSSFSKSSIDDLMKASLQKKLGNVKLYADVGSGNVFVQDNAHLNTLQKAYGGTINDDGALLTKVGSQELTFKVDSNARDNFMELSQVDAAIRSSLGENGQLAINDAIDVGVPSNRLEFHSPKKELTFDNLGQFQRDELPNVKFRTTKGGDGWLIIEKAEEWDAVKNAFAKTNGAKISDDQIEINVNGKTKLIVFDDRYSRFGNEIVPEVQDIGRFLLDTNENYDYNILGIGDDLGQSPRDDYLEQSIEIQRGSPTKIIQNAVEENPYIEHAFYKLSGGRVISAAQDQTSSSVRFIPVDELPGDVISEIRLSTGATGAPTRIHNHPMTAPVDVLPSGHDVSSFLLNSERSFIIAFTDGNNGEVMGYFVMRKESIHFENSQAGNNFREYIDDEVVNLDAADDARYLLAFHVHGDNIQRGGIQNGLNKLKKDFRINARYVPNRNAGYEWDANEGLFVKDYE